MKTVIMVLLFSIPTIFYAQDTVISNPKNAIGINLNYDSFYGIAAEFLYDRHVGKSFYVRGSILTNNRSIFGISDGKYIFRSKLGLHKTILSYKYFDIDVGINLTSNAYDYSSLGVGEGHYFGSEVPIQLRFHINPNFDINVSANFSNRSKLPVETSNFGINLGVYKRF